MVVVVLATVVVVEHGGFVVVVFGLVVVVLHGGFVVVVWCLATIVALGPAPPAWPGIPPAFTSPNVNVPKAIAATVAAAVIARLLE